MGDNEPKRRTLSRFVHGPGRVLEIGCATGNVAQAFDGLDYVGVDVDGRAIARARDKFPGGSYRFLCLDILQDELPDAPGFDFVVISHTAHHLSDDYFRRLLGRSAELLAEGGRLVILDMIRPERHDPWGKRFFHWLDRGAHFRDLDEFRELLSAQPSLVDLELHVVEMSKLGFPVTDDVAILATKRSTAPTRVGGEGP